MAHVLVYLQRTAYGLHPASATALCVARDIGTERGASILAICPGDAGPSDEAIARAAAHFGCDGLAFTRADGLERRFALLRPVHVLTPYTPEGLAAIEGLPGGPAAARWLDDPQPQWASADAITAIVAGTLPWHRLNSRIDPEYEQGLEPVHPPTTLSPAIGFVGRGPGPLYFAAPVPGSIDATLQAQLATLQAIDVSTASEDEIAALTGTLLVFEKQHHLPALHSRSSALRVILLPETGSGLHPNWRFADIVLPGNWADALRELHSELWKSNLI